jgi:hypothetical protein
MTAAPAPNPPPEPTPAEPPTAPGSDPVTLQPHYGVGLTVLAAGLAALGLLPLWSGAPLITLLVGGFGLFLLLQSALLRLEFHGDALLVRRGDTLLRRFPYDEWQAWRVFWPGLPVLFYFREVRSIHFLPVLFDPATLQSQLRLRLAGLARPAEDDAPPV